MALFSPSSRLVFSLCVLFSAATTATCLPQTSHELSNILLKRHENIITADNGTMYVADPTTGLPIPQGVASDGGGYGFDAPAIVWFVWSFVVGAPLCLAGVRLYRITTGASIGMATTVLVWAAFVNTLNASGISDVVLVALSMGAFGLGFIFGSLNVGRVAGITLLGVMGGMSIGVRIILFRPGLLVPNLLYVNWLIITVIGVIGFLLVVIQQRAAITGGSAAVGTFLIALGIDLSINRQEGMSQGLRFLFDRNNAHLVDLFTIGWQPPISTEIIMAVSLGAAPLFAVMQHYVFKRPFKRVRSDSLTSIIDHRESPCSSRNSAQRTVDPDEAEPLSDYEKTDKTSERTDSGRDRSRKVGEGS